MFMIAKCVCIWRRSCTILYLSYLWYLHYVHAMTKIRSQAIVVGHQLCVAANICCLEGREFDLESLTAHGCKASLLSMMSTYGMSEHDSTAPDGMRHPMDVLDPFATGSSISQTMGSAWIHFLRKSMAIGGTNFIITAILLGILHGIKSQTAVMGIHWSQEHEEMTEIKFAVLGFNCGWLRSIGSRHGFIMYIVPVH